MSSAGNSIGWSLSVAGGRLTGDIGGITRFFIRATTLPLPCDRQLTSPVNSRPISTACHKPPWGAPEIAMPLRAPEHIERAEFDVEAAQFE